MGQTQQLDLIFNNNNINNNINNDHQDHRNSNDQINNNKKSYILNQIKQFYNFMTHYTKSKPNETTMQLIITVLSRSNELHLLSKYIPFSTANTKLKNNKSAHSKLHPMQN